jgi:hypothetical protein
MPFDIAFDYNLDDVRAGNFLTIRSQLNCGISRVNSILLK